MDSLSFTSSSWVSDRNHRQHYKGGLADISTRDGLLHIECGNLHPTDKMSRAVGYDNVMVVPFANAFVLTYEGTLGFLIYPSDRSIVVDGVVTLPKDDPPVELYATKQEHHELWLRQQIDELNANGQLFQPKHKCTCLCGNVHDVEDGPSRPWTITDLRARWVELGIMKS